VNNLEKNSISPTNDLAFKKVLASEENKDILGGFISDFFEIAVSAEEITIENPYSIEVYKEFVKGTEVMTLRDTIKDVSASFKTANFISELQIKNSNYFDERALYYPFNRFCQNYDKAGDMKYTTDGRAMRYSSLKPIYALNVLGYPHFQGDDEALRIFELYDPKRNKKFKELFRIGFFELTKTVIETNNQKYWHDFFITGEVETQAPEYIKKASQIIKWVNLSEEERNVSMVLEKAEEIRKTELDYSYNEGKEKGIIEVAKKLIKRQISLEDISEDTGLSISELQEIKEASENNF
jgi:predicted transposase/invertase (TIGR01784 family)